MIDYLKKYDYRALLGDLQKLKAQFPETLRTEVIGYSAYGRKLVSLSVGTGAKTLLLLGTHHGREYITSAFLMQLCESFLKNAENQKICKKAKLVILPMINPDGAEISIHGPADFPEIAAMPLLSGSCSAWKANGNGVDLNRNYPCLWEKKRTIISCPASEMYNGPFAASEPEVRAVMQYTEKISPDLAVTLHTKGEEIYYADANTPDLQKESMEYAALVSARSGYTILPPSQDPAVFAAGYENWFREKFYRPCLLIEAGVYDGPEPFRTERFEVEILKKLQNFERDLLLRLIDT